MLGPAEVLHHDQGLVPVAHRGLGPALAEHRDRVPAQGESERGTGPRQVNSTTSLTFPVRERER